MDFLHAFEQLKKGVAVRREEWGRRYLRMVKGKLHSFPNIGHTLKDSFPVEVIGKDDALAEDWEKVRE